MANLKYSWTEKEINLLRCKYHNTKTLELALMLKRPLHSIYAKARELGLKKYCLPLPPEFEAQPESVTDTEIPVKKNSAHTFYGEQADGSYRCRLGWVFSAEDCRREKEVCNHVEIWFEKHYGGKKKKIHSSANL